MQRLLTDAQQKVDGEETIIIRRRKILKDTLPFLQEKDESVFLREASVNFSGEEGVDLGGPKREFFTYSTKQRELARKYVNPV